GGLAGLAEHEEAALGPRELDHVVHDDLEEAVEVELAVERLRDALEADEPVLLLLGAREVGLRVEDDRVAEVLFGGRRLLEPDARPADADHVAGAKRRAVDQVAVDRRAVLAAEVDEHVLVAVALDAAMTS